MQVEAVFFSISIQLVLLVMEVVGKVNIQKRPPGKPIGKLQRFCWATCWTAVHSNSCFLSFLLKAGERIFEVEIPVANFMVFPLNLRSIKH